MALRIALDTNSYADYARGLDSVTGIIRHADLVAIPFVVLGELRAGFRCGRFEAENESDLARFLAGGRVSVHFADEATTRFYADIYASLRRNGTPIPTNDIWIAALAIQHDLTLLSRDKHFELVPYLSRM